MKKNLIAGLILGLFLLSMNPGVTMGAVPEDVFIWETTTGEPDSLDAAICYETRGGRVIQVVYETLYAYDGSSTDLIPNLADSYTISADGLTWVFTLRDDVTFQDGTAFNASAMKYSIDRTVLMNDPDGPAWMISQAIDGAPEYAWGSGNQNVTEAETWLDLEAIKVIDETHLEINLELAYIPFLAAMTYGVGSAVSPSYVYANRLTTVPDGGDYTFDTGDNDTDMVDMGEWFPALAGTGSGIVPGHQNKFMNSHMCGTGPYELVEWNQAVQLHLTAADNWWKANQTVGGRYYQAPVIKDVYQKIVSEAATRILDLEKEDCDAAYVPATNMPEIYDLAKDKVLKDNLQVNKYPSFTVMYMGACLNDTMTFEEAGDLWLEEAATSTYDAATLDKYSSLNPDTSKASPDNPFTALKFREAVAHAFDYDQFIDTALNGWGTRMIGVIPEGMFGHVSDLDLPETDAALAKSKFEDVGWEGNIVLGYNAGNTVREAGCLLLKDVIEDLDVGITIEVKEFEWSIYLDHIRHQHLGIFFIGWAPDYADPDNYVDPFLNSQGTLGGRQQYENADIDTWIDEGKEEADPVARAAIYKNIEEAAAADVAQIYCYQAVNYLVDQDYIQGLDGFSTNPMQSGRQYDELWKEEPSSPAPGFQLVIAILGLAGIEIIRRRR